MKFSQWLNQQLKIRQMRQAEFARSGDISPSAVQRVIAGHRRPGENMLRAASKAFEMPLLEIYKIAGVIPENGVGQQYSLEDRQILELLKGLSPEQKKQAVDFISFLRQNS